MVVVPASQPDICGVNFVDWNYMIEPKKQGLTPTENLKKFQIGSQKFHTTKLDGAMTEVQEENLVALIRKNIDMFVWIPT